MNISKEQFNKLATKDDLKKFITKEDAKKFATKDDLKKFITKEDAKKFATKEDMDNKFSEFAQIMALTLQDYTTKQEFIDFKTEIIDEFHKCIDPVTKKLEDIQIELLSNQRAHDRFDKRITKLEQARC